MAIADFFKPDDVDLRGLAAYLNELDNDARIRAARSFSSKQQKLLFEAAEGHKPLELADFAPPSVPPLTTIIHYGYNNQVPGLRVFEKRMTKPGDAAITDKLYGYNEFFLKGLVGPGYFVVKPAEAGEVVVDYYDQPPEAPQGWPPIVPNERGLGRFVYAEMRDYMRGISRHVTIGRAVRKGKITNNFFVLCRDGKWDEAKAA